MATLLNSEAFTVSRPLTWLISGWRDLWVHPVLSFGLGSVFVLIGAALCAALLRARSPELIPAAVAGFSLVGPILACGVYEISRKIEAGEVVRVSDLMGRSWFREGTFVVGLILMFIMLAWMRIAEVLVASFFPTIDMTFPAFLLHLLTTTEGYVFLAVGTSIGAVIASVVFAISAFSIPMLVDRDIDALTAMLESVRVVLAKPIASLLWAACIGMFVVVCIATAFAGLIIAFPLLGHASWHAYRSLAVR